MKYIIILICTLFISYSAKARTHFAELDKDGIVLRVIVVDDKDAIDGENFCKNLLGGDWKQTSKDTKAGIHVKDGTAFRKNYAGIGFKYDTGRDAFIPPKPYPSWTEIDEDKGQYKAPKEQPDDGKDYGWDESTLSWKTVQ